MQLKKFIQKDRHGNMMHIEFEPEANVPPMQQIPMPMYDHPGEPKGTDTVPAWLTPGENVINAEASRLPGVQPMLDNLNNIGRGIQEQQGGSIPAYADKGGQVQNNKLRIYNHLKNKWALNNNQIAAVMGQIGHETGNTFDYKMLEKNVDTNVRGEGLFQNTPGSTRMLEPYLKYLNKNEISNSPESQIDFFMDSFMTKGAVPREDDKTTKENEASPWYHGSGKADRMREAFTNPDLRLNVNFDDDKPSLVGELTRFINVPGESLAKRNDSTIAMTNWIDQYGMKVIPGAPNNKGQLFEPGSTTSFPGEENYESTINDEPGFVDKLKGAYNTIKKFKLEEGGKIPEVVYADHGYPHWLSPSTWNKQHWQGKGNIEPEVKEVPPMNNNTMVPIGSVSSARMPGQIGNINPADAMNALDVISETNFINQQLEEANKKIPPKVESTSNIDNTSTSENFNDSTNISTSSSNFGDVITYKLGDGANQIYKKNLRTGVYEDQYDRPMNMKVQEEFNITQSGNWDETDRGPNPFSNYTKELGGKNVITINDTITKLEKKAQEEVDNTGSVSNETVLEITKKKGELSQNKKHEEKNIIDDNKEMESLEDDLKNKYEAAKQSALGAGITEFPSFEEWSAKYESDKWKSIRAHQDNKNILQQVADGDTTTTTTTEEKSNEVANVSLAIDPKEKGPDDGANETESNTIETTVVTKGNEGNSNQKSSAYSVIKGIFGDLFDTKELKRMAIVYLGSRLMGYNHNGSLKYVAKSYLNRVDTKSAARAKWIRENATKYKPASLKLYQETGDWSKLQPIGATVRSTGNSKTYYVNVRGKAFAEEAREFKTTDINGKDITFYSIDGGKSEIPTAFKSDPKLVKGTPEYKKQQNVENEIIKTNTAVVKDIIKGISDRYDKKVVKLDKVGNKKTTYATDILPSASAYELSKWSMQKGFNLNDLGGPIQIAYEAAIQDAKNSVNPKRAKSLIPYMEQGIITHDTKLPALSKDETSVNNKTFTTSNDTFLKLNDRLKASIKNAKVNTDNAQVMKEIATEQGMRNALNQVYTNMSVAFLNLPLREREILINQTPDGYTPLAFYINKQIGN